MSVGKIEKKAELKETQWTLAKTVNYPCIYLHFQKMRILDYNNPELINIIYSLHIEFKII